MLFETSTEKLYPTALFPAEKKDNITNNKMKVKNLKNEARLVSVIKRIIIDNK